MKVYYKTPTKEVRIIKPDNGVEEYEFWILVPVFIGHAHKAGTQRVMCEGMQFTNLSSAVQHCLASKGETDLAGAQRHFVNRPTAKVEVKGVELLRNDAWARFCKSRNLSVENTELLGKSYYLTREELVQFGLKQPGDT